MKYLLKTRLIHRIKNYTLSLIIAIFSQLYIYISYIVHY